LARGRNIRATGCLLFHKGKGPITRLIYWVGGLENLKRGEPQISCAIPAACKMRGKKSTRSIRYFAIEIQTQVKKKKATSSTSSSKATIEKGEGSGKQSSRLCRPGGRPDSRHAFKNQVPIKISRNQTKKRISLSGHHKSPR